MGKRLLLMSQQSSFIDDRFFILWPRPRHHIRCPGKSGHFLQSGLLALNSYENRVYQFLAEDGQRYVAKFYRPGRWTDAQILKNTRLQS